MAKVAVITRTKDRPVFLKRAIQSIADQTYDDYQHVIVNDGGSTQEVDNIVASFPEKIKQKIAVFHREQPSGAPDTIFNESIDRVKSDYIALHDDDDTWHPDFLLKTVTALNSGAAGAVVRTDNVYEKVDGINIKQTKTSRYMPEIKAISLYRQCLDNQLTAVAFVYRRDSYEAIGKYDNTLPVVGDWEFGLRFLMKYDVEYIDPGYALAFYHRRENSDNSFAKYDHRTYLTKVLNRYLREDIEKKQFGVGYIMNDLWYGRDKTHDIVRHIIPSPLQSMLRKRRR